MDGNLSQGSGPFLTSSYKTGTGTFLPKPVPVSFELQLLFYNYC